MSQIAQILNAYRILSVKNLPENKKGVYNEELVCILLLYYIVF